MEYCNESDGDGEGDLRIAVHEHKILKYSSANL